MVENASEPSFSVEVELQRVREDVAVSSVSTFLDTNTPMPIRVTTAQQICNMNDHRDVALVFDMRSAAQYTECSLDKSVNFALERFNEDTFINWTQKVKELETDPTIFRDKYEVDKMKKRKRRFCYIIPCH